MTRQPLAYFQEATEAEILTWLSVLARTRGGGSPDG